MQYSVFTHTCTSQSQTINNKEYLHKNFCYFSIFLINDIPLFARPRLERFSTDRPTVRFAISPGYIPAKASSSAATAKRVATLEAAWFAVVGNDSNEPRTLEARDRCWSWYGRHGILRQPFTVTRDSDLLLHANHSAFYWGDFKENHTFLWFKALQTNPRNKKLESIHGEHF